MSGNRLYHLNINVADLDRSIAFYKILGFKVIHRETLDDATMRDVAEAFDDEPNAAEYALIRIGDDPAAACIDLVQWKTRPAYGTVYNKPNHLGIYRFLVHVEDPEGVLAALIEAGHPPIGRVLRPSPDRGSSVTMFNVRDPDGAVIEIASNLGHLVD